MGFPFEIWKSAIMHLTSLTKIVLSLPIEKIVLSLDEKLRILVSMEIIGHIHETHKG